VSIVDALEQFWQGILNVTSLFVIPDWGALVNLLPIFLLVLVIGPILSLVVLLWLVYVVRAPRAGTVTVEPGPRAAAIGGDGLPDFPAGEPYCTRDALVYPPNARRCDTCGTELSVACPKCGVTRRAAIEACANCGLVLKVEPRAVAVRAAGPPPEGAAAA
jgi:hypothetical protein